jgi:DNA-binding transcriptional regulator PaaX
MNAFTALLTCTHSLTMETTQDLRRTPSKWPGFGYLLESIRKKPLFLFNHMVRQ